MQIQFTSWSAAGVPQRHESEQAAFERPDAARVLIEWLSDQDQPFRADVTRAASGEWRSADGSPYDTDFSPLPEEW